MFKATAFIVASTGTYHGVALSRSPKRAVAEAQNRAELALLEGDRKARYCSGISVDGFTLRDTASNRVVADIMNI